jgi:hypothetical protein
LEAQRTRSRQGDCPVEPKTGKSLTQNQSLRLNALSNWATLGVSTVVAFLLTPFIIRHLGKTGYGIWALVGSLTGYYGLFNLGVDSALTRYIARYAAQGDEESLNETASTAIIMFCCTGIVVVIVSFLMAEPLARFFQVGPEQLADFRHVVRIIGFVTGLSFPASVFAAIIRAHERFVAVNCATVVITLLQSALVVLFLAVGWGLSGVALASLGGGLTALVVNYFLSRRLTPHLRIRLALAKWSVFRMLIAYGSVTTIIVAADLVRGSQMDSFVVGKWVGLSAVGVYAIASVTNGYVVRLVMPVYISRIAGLSLREYLRPLLPSCLIASLMTAAAHYLGIVTSDTPSIAYLVRAGMIAGAVYMAACCLLRYPGTEVSPASHHQKRLTVHLSHRILHAQVVLPRWCGADRGMPLWRRGRRAWAVEGVGGH